MVEEKKQPDPIDLEVGYETEDLSIRGMVIFGIGLTIVIIVAFILIGLMYNFFDVQVQAGQAPAPPLMQQAEPLPPSPRVQRAPVEAMQRLRSVDEAVLDSYGWVDEEAGVVRIPIERAMELFLEREGPEPAASSSEDDM